MPDLAVTARQLRALAEEAEAEELYPIDTVLALAADALEFYPHEAVVERLILRLDMLQDETSIDANEEEWDYLERALKVLRGRADGGGGA